MQSSKEQQGEIRKPSSVINAKKPRKTTEWGKTRDLFKKIRDTKGTFQAKMGCILSPCLFNLYAEYIMRNAGLDEAQAGIKTEGRNIYNLRYADDTTLMAESEKELNLQPGIYCILCQI